MNRLEARIIANKIANKIIHALIDLHVLSYSTLDVNKAFEIENKLTEIITEELKNLERTPL